MNKARLKSIERRVETKEDLIAPIIVYTENDKLIFNRDFIEALGYSTEDLKTPEEGGALQEPGDPTLCLLPRDHKAVEIKGDYLEFKGVKGRSIVL